MNLNREGVGQIEPSQDGRAQATLLPTVPEHPSNGAPSQPDKQAAKKPGRKPSVKYFAIVTGLLVVGLAWRWRSGPQDTSPRHLCEWEGRDSQDRDEQPRIIDDAFRNYDLGRGRNKAWKRIWS